MKTRSLTLVTLTCAELFCSALIIQANPGPTEPPTESWVRLAQCFGCGNGNGNGNIGALNGNLNGNLNTGVGNGNGNGNGNGAPQTNGNLGYMNGGTGNVGAFNGLGNSSTTSGNNNVGARKRKLQRVHQ